jgi:predicted nucleotidyltransferase component of viral defense system
LAKLLPKVVSKIEEEGVFLKTQESKTTSGGFLALFEGKLFAEKVRLELNISLRKRIKPEPILVTTPLHPSYQCLTLPIAELVREKCEALLSRRKPRDYYDLYFLLRERLGIEVIASLKKRLIESTQSIDVRQITRELKIFLPISHHQIVTKLDTLLLGELNRL